MYWDKSEGGGNRGRSWLYHFSVWDIVLTTSPLSDPLYSSINVDDGRIFSIVLLQKVSWCRTFSMLRTLPGIPTLLRDPWLFSISWLTLVEKLSILSTHQSHPEGQKTYWAPTPKFLHKVWPENLHFQKVLRWSWFCWSGAPCIKNNSWGWGPESVF